MVLAGTLTDGVIEADIGDQAAPPNCSLSQELALALPDFLQKSAVSSQAAPLVV